MPVAGLTGARESTAGDEFHIRWAVRRVIGLLDPSSGLEQVVIEDLEAVPSADIPEELLLGVDMAEYFGGADLRMAARVVVSQLKYSTRNPNTAWTAARLAPASDPDGKSVIKRLADVYVGIRATNDVATVRDRLTIQLVSNQPCAEQLAQTLAAAKLWLDQHSDRCRFADLVRAMPDQQAHDDLKRLWDTSRLRSYDFTEFLRVFTLDNLGQAGLAAQELAITAALGEHVLNEPEGASLQLQKLVRDYALPEARGQAITRGTLLAKLGVFREQDLLPAPSRLISPERPVPTSDSTRILDALDRAPDRRILVHGDAGVGKTTAVVALRDALPEGSVVVTYDCFAGGDYLNAGEARHAERRFCLQLCNELAIQCRLPILIKPPDNDEDLWRAVSRSLERAAGLLSAQGGRMLLVVDAADNSAWAAQNAGEDSFLGPLWRLRIPAGAGLIVTCRTHRRGDLGTPDGLTEVELHGFDEAESAAHLRAWSLDATADDARAFHAGNDGNPRVQAYALNTADYESDNALVHVIEQARRVPADIFGDLYAEAVQHVPEASNPREKLAELICLTKPLSGNRFAAISGLAADIVRDFCRGLEPGVAIEGDLIAFRDEDFATYLVEKVGDDELKAAHGRLADRFLEQPEDSDAAIAVAEHLHNAGRDVDLIKLALDEPPPAAVEDPLLRQQTYRRRLFLALRHASKPEQRLVACKLLVLFAEAARHNLAVRKLLRDRPDLGMRYGEPETVARIYAEESEPDWLGPLHMRLAGIYAGLGDQSAATAHCEQAHAWLRRRFLEDESWPIEAEDVASLAEASFYFNGSKDAAAEVDNWRPPEFREEVWEHLVRRVVRAGQRDVSQLLNIAGVPGELRARRFAAAYMAGAGFETQSLLELVDAITANPPEVGREDGAWVAGFVELAASAGGDTESLIRLCDALALPVPSHAPHRYSWLGDFRDPLRVAAIRAVCVGKPLDIELLMPASVTDVGDDYRERSRADEERRLMGTQVGRFVAVYEARAKAIVTSCAVADLAAIRARLTPEPGATGVYSNETDYGHSRWLSAFMDALLACRGTDLSLVRAVVEEVPRAASGDQYQCWLTIARKLVTDDRYRTEGLLLLEKAATFIEEAEVPANEKIEALLDACAIADPVDRVQAQDLHARAVIAAESMDDEGAARLQLHACVTETLQPGPECRPLLNRVAAAVARYRLRVSDDRRLPWVETIKATATIDPQTAAVLICRWEDEGLTPLEQSIDAAVVPFADGPLFTAEDALALLDLSGEEASSMPATTDLLDRVDPGPDRAVALTHTCERIRRDLLGHARSSAAAALRGWASANGLGTSSCVTALEPYVEPERERVDRGPWRDQASADRAEREWTAKREAQRQEASRILERARDPSARSLEEDLSKLVDVSQHQQISDYLNEYLAWVTVAQRQEFLTALAAVPSDHPASRFHADDLLDTAIAAAEQWSGSSRIQPQLQATLVQILRTHLVSLMRYHQPGAPTLSRLLDISVFEDAAKPLLESLFAHADHLPPAALYGLATDLTRTLDNDERMSLVGWSLDQLDIPSTTNSALPTTRQETLAGLLWRLLGAPDKAIRWRAAHTARHLLSRRDPVLARALWDRVLRTNADPFTSPGAPFLWMSARLWALLLLARMARDAPTVVAPLLPEITEVAMDESYPHAAIREFAKRAALDIDASGAGNLHPEIREQLGFVNAPPACMRERQVTYGTTDRRNRDWDSERFHFGMTDTLPYIYGPFGARFGLDVEEICTRAETWILDRLGLADQDGRDPRLDRYHHNASYATHGALPRVESWHEMLETHALQLVAGELCDQRVPIIYEPYDEEPDPWMDWIERYLDSPRDSWIVDLRNPTPPRAELLLHDATSTGWPTIDEHSLDDFVHCFGPEVLVVEAGVSFSTDFGYGGTYMSSALVDPAHAHALMRLLQTTEEPRAFTIPVQFDGWDVDREEISDGDFKLLAWLWEERDRGDRNIEEHDPLARVNRTLVRPGEAFISHCGGTLSRGGRDVIGSDGTLIATQISWSDIAPVGDGRDNSDGTSGHLTTGRCDAVNAFLGDQRMWLLLLALATRTVTRRYTMEDEDDEQKVHQVYVYKPDGTVATMGGALKAG